MSTRFGTTLRSKFGSRITRALTAVTAATAAASVAVAGFAAPAHAVGGLPAYWQFDEDFQSSPETRWSVAGSNGGSGGFWAKDGNQFGFLVADNVPGSVASLINDNIVVPLPSGPPTPPFPYTRIACGGSIQLRIRPTSTPAVVLLGAVDYSTGDILSLQRADVTSNEFVTYQMRSWSTSIVIPERLRYRVELVGEASGGRPFVAVDNVHMECFAA